MVVAWASLGLVPAAAGASEGCANEALREERHLTFLADCRAYEMVSPAQKGGAQVTLGPGSFRASSAGGAIVFDSNVASGDARATGGAGVVTFRSDRRGEGWETHTLFPVQEVNAFALFTGPQFEWFAPDLSHGLLNAGDPALVPGAPQGVSNLYLTDGSGGAPQLISASVNPVNPGLFVSQPVDASSDFGAVAFESPLNLTADAPEQPSPECAFGFGCDPRLYIWERGTVHLAGVLPDGTPAPEGAAAGQADARVFGDDVDSAFSEDGKRLYFTAPPHGGSLYLRKNESSTAMVSQSEASAPEEPPLPAQFAGASADGTRAVFMTSEHLLDEDQNATNDVYMYTDSANPAAESNLTLLSRDAEPSDGSEANVAGVLGVSRDGERVYFATNTDQLVQGAPTGAGPKLYVWDHGVVRYIATLASALQDEFNWRTELFQGTSRMSADGHYLLFTSTTPQVSGFDDGGHAELYRYDVATQQIACVSCGSGAGPARASGEVNFVGATATAQYAYRDRALASGGRVFLDTAEALVPEDTNGKVDAYEWEDNGTARGTVHLLSDGRSESDSFFVDASEDGSDAYFVTRRQLVKGDVDQVLDLYDARLDGGLPEAPTAATPCSGEACQGPFAQPPGAVASASSTPGGGGNLSPAVKRAPAKTSTKAAKLAKALRACRKQTKGRRKRCESRARKRYGAHKASKLRGSK